PARSSLSRMDTVSNVLVVGEIWRPARLTRWSAGHLRRSRRYSHFEGGAPPGGTRRPRRTSAGPSGLVAQGEQPVVERVPAVDHGGPTALGITEQIEVVPHELHLLQGLVHGHRGAVVLLATDDLTGQLVLDPVRVPVDRLGGRGVGRELRGRLSDGLGSTVPRVADLAAGPRLAHLPLELGDRRFQGRVEGVLRRLGTCDAGLAPEGDLDALTDLRQT